MKARVEKLWDVVDSVALMPPACALAPEQVMAYAAAIARLFYC